MLKKKRMSFVLVIVMGAMLLNCVPVAAAGSPIPSADAVQVSAVPAVDTQNADTLYNINPRLRGNNIPTTFWDLTAKGAYSVQMGPNGQGGILWTYTNYIFNPNSSGEIFIDNTNMTSDNQDMYIECYVSGTNALATTWVGKPLPAGTVVKFYNLSTSNRYYFKFGSTPNYFLGGTGSIYNHR